MDLCLPAVVYFFLSFIQIIVDCSNKLYNMAILKFIITLLFMFILNLMCINGLTVLSWIFVLIPFIFMTIIVSVLLYGLNLDKSVGTIDTKKIPPPKKSVFPYIFTDYQ